MNKYGRMLLISLVTGSLIATPVYAAPKTESLKAQKAAAENEADALQQELVELLDKIGKLEEDLIAKGEEIIQAEEDLEDAKELEELQYEAMKLRIKYMYEGGTTTALETLISAESFSDLLNKAEYVAEVHLYDRSKLQEYEETKQKVEDLKEQLIDEQSNMQIMQAEYEAKEATLTTTLEEKREEIAGFDEQIQAAAEAAAREAAEREAKRKADAANTGSAGRTTRTSGTSTSTAETTTSGETATSGESTVSGEAAADTAVPSDTTTTENDEGGNSGEQLVDSADTTDESGTSEIVDTDNSGLEESSDYQGNTSAAQTIVNAAYGQLGVPYVYGGNGDGGWDCSGLVQYCHSVAGISLPRTSEAQGGCGVAVSDPQPGDIVCYGTHVGIYIGGGQMIHAPKPGDNVKVAAVYGSPWYRRCW